MDMKVIAHAFFVRSYHTIKRACTVNQNTLLIVDKMFYLHCDVHHFTNPQGVNSQCREDWHGSGGVYQ